MRSKGTDAMTRQYAKRNGLTIRRVAACLDYPNGYIKITDPDVEEEYIFTDWSDARTGCMKALERRSQIQARMEQMRTGKETAAKQKALLMLAKRAQEREEKETGAFVWGK